MIKRKKKGGGWVNKDEKERWFSLSFCTSPCRNLVFICLCSISLGARRVLGSNGPRCQVVPWFLSTRKNLFFLMECIPSFVGFVWNLFRRTPAGPCCLLGPVSFTFFFSSNSAFVRSLFKAQLRLVARCENGAYKPFAFILHYLFGAGAFFFCVFGLLVALNIMSGDLKLCRECVIVEFIMTSFLTGGTLLMSSFFFFLNWLLAQFYK